MPWSTTDMNSIRREFVTKALLKQGSFAALCREYGVSRRTGYKWRARALQEGLQRLAEHSRRPKRSPGQLDEATVCALIRLKLRHPLWGPKKIRLVYAREQAPAPSLSSCQRVLARAGLVVKRRRRACAQTSRLNTAAVARAPNQVWTVDFKGWWRTQDGQRCEPLTVRDAFSCFILAASTLAQADTAAVQAEFMRLFQLYGLPEVIKSDNGAPFASPTAPLGLSRLSAWWIALGIELDRSRPAHPQDNGAHERMHRDLQAEISRCVQSDPVKQQAALDVWREEFNWQRPHEKLDGRTPGQVYHKSDRSLPATIGPLDYGPGFFPRKITPSGTLRWKGRAYGISQALAGWHVGVRYRDADHLEVFFAHLLLGEIELSSLSFVRAASRPHEPTQLSA